MKKAVNILTVISIISVALLLLLITIMMITNTKTSFIAELILGVLLIPSVPLFFRSSSLLFKRNKIKPKSWLIKDLIITTMVIIFLFICGLGNRVADLQNLFHENYSNIDGFVDSIDFNKSSQTLYINNQKFVIQDYLFNYVTIDKEYSVIYLPNSHYVIDIVDKNGETLAKRR